MSRPGIPPPPCVVALFALIVASTGAADESSLTVVDLAAYRAALAIEEGRDGPPATATVPVPVGFRELWDRPAAYRGRRVQVEGRIVRRFRQGSFGTFPPLVEAWAVNPAGDPFCLVFPSPPADRREAGSSAEVPVRFAGTFLKLVTYRGGDGPRLAPLIVGPAPPIAATVAVDRGSKAARVPGSGLTRLDWAIGLGAASLVALVLARKHLGRPVRHARDVEVATPLFLDDRSAPRRADSP